MKQLRPLLIALQFLTLLPINFRQPPENTESGRSLLYYPLVGLLIGLSIGANLWLFGGLSTHLCAALTLTLWVLLTGGLHLDGLADSADGWLGGYGDREKTLHIMHDPYCGPIGVITLLLLLLLKFTALEALISNGATALPVLVPLLGRTALVALFLTTPYVRAGGLGALLAQHMPEGESLAVVAMVLLLVPLWQGEVGFYLLLAAASALFTLRLLMLRRIGGTTGDTAGAMVEICETVTLLVAAMMTSGMTVNG